MAERMRNIANLFKEGKTRVIILTTLTVLLIAIIVGVLSLRNRIEDKGSAGVARTPASIGSVPFSAPSEEYARLQQTQNVEQAKQAEQAGTSAIPTIIRAENEAAPTTEENAEAGVGFTTLNRLQSDADTFTAKEFNTGRATSTNCVVVEGTPVYDKNGKLIGYVGADGKVRDLTGKVIGNLEPDGTVRDANGNILGRVAQGTSGAPVYDKNGKLIGYVGADGQVRDANGKVIGTVGPDGTVRDANGNVIGTVGAAIPGTPVYDQNGNLIGTVGPDGLVRDANGHVIGTVGPDGVVRDTNGKIIGRAGAIVAGTPVYDEQGNLLGYVGTDGKVRDATGRVIGTVGSDGLVRDPTGKVIGRTGTPVYDDQGNLLGFAGPDGKVRDANGNVIGTVGADGVVRDLNGKIIGKAGAIPPGTPVYDQNGNLIGTVGPDGKVRDANGNVIGTLGVDGKVRDANGNIIGSTIKSQAAAGESTPANVAQAATSQAAGQIEAQPTAQQIAASTESLAAAQQRQMAILQDQNLQQLVQQKQQAMTSQANQLLAAWTSPIQQYVAGQPEVTSTTGGGGGGAQGGTGQPSGGPVFIKAGTVFFGLVNTSINSDEPGPIMATIVSGPYKGGKLLGTLTYQTEAVMLTFNTLSLPNFSQSISINAVAIDQNTARTALSTYTDNHYLLRYGSLFAASFLQGYGQAFTQSGSETSTNGLTTTTTTPNLSGTGKFYAALGNVGAQFSTQLNSVYNTPPTVYVSSGTPVGILFLSDVQMPTS